MYKVIRYMHYDVGKEYSSDCPVIAQAYPILGRMNWMDLFSTRYMYVRAAFSQENG